MKTYKSTTDMIKAAIAAGYEHVGGKGSECVACKQVALNDPKAGHAYKFAMRRFRKDNKSVRKCKHGHVAY
jgi:hypothetical protein